MYATLSEVSNDLLMTHNTSRFKVIKSFLNFCPKNIIFDNVFKNKRTGTIFELSKTL